MLELLRTIRIVGLRDMIELLRGYRLGWLGIIRGFYTTRTMQALFNVGFFDEIHEKATVDIAAFAASRDLDVNILRSLCESLYALRILDQVGAGYSLTRRGRTLVVVARGWFDGAYGYEDVFHNLEALLKKERSYGGAVGRRCEFITRGSALMEARLHYPMAADYIAAHRITKVLDIGCGDGSFLRYLCAKDPSVTGVGIDIAPEAIALARQEAKAQSLEDRIQFLVQDVLQLSDVPDFPARVEIATMFFVLHELLARDGDSAVDMLAAFRRLFPGMALLIFEAIRPTPEDRRRRPGMAVEYVLQHDLSHQPLRSRQEWRLVFQEAGFSSVHERYLDFARTAIYVLS